jgi:hypothetical protein
MIPYKDIEKSDAAERIAAALPNGCETSPVYNAGDYLYFGRTDGKVYAVVGMQTGVGRSYTERTECIPEEDCWPHWCLGVLSAFGPYTLS